MGDNEETARKYLVAKALHSQGRGYGFIAKTLGYRGKSSVQYLLNQYKFGLKDAYRASIVVAKPSGVKIINAVADNEPDLAAKVSAISSQAISELHADDKQDGLEKRA